MLLLAIPACPSFQTVLPLLLALLVVYPVSLCGAERANRFKSVTRLVFLPDNEYSSKCLDGSTPAYYFPRGGGRGRRKWHVHLPQGGWCFSPLECRERANSPLGSSHFWATRLPAVVENGGKINNHWPAAACTGEWRWRVALESGAGEWRWRVTLESDAPALAGGTRHPSRIHSWAGSYHRTAQPTPCSTGGTWCGWCTVTGGAYSSTRGRADLGEGASVYMQGRQILDDIITGGQQIVDHITTGGWGGEGGRDKEGVGGHGEECKGGVSGICARRGAWGRRRRMSYSRGSSAGGHAIIMHCDRLAAAFPHAKATCLADSGFFVDAKDRFGVYSWRESIRQLTALHLIEVHVTRGGKDGYGEGMGGEVEGMGEGTRGEGGR
ncbi:unnamed protein product [Closterium sp. Naga37s-1]|nr:unnamed protein product [Closterium sp. Naga37s-1]